MLTFLPFYYLHRYRQYRENLEVEYEIQIRIEEYAEELGSPASDVGNYDPKEYEESPKKYLGGI